VLQTAFQSRASDLDRFGWSLACGYPLIDLPQVAVDWMSGEYPQNDDGSAAIAAVETQT
jgi:hypothetical protein